MSNEQEEKATGLPEAIKPIDGELSEKDLEKAAGGAGAPTSVPAVQMSSGHETWNEPESFDIGGSE